MSKNAIVFGATSGIGKKLADLLVKDEYRVLITGRRLNLLKEIEATNPLKYIIKQHDINDIETTDKLFEELGNVFDTVDLIVHNSGIGEVNPELEWEKDFPTIQTNVIGATKVYQLAYNYFLNQGFGHLVGVSSIASIRGSKDAPVYHASKAFQASYLESLWMKASQTHKKIDITNILPGFVDTDIIMGDTFWMASVEKATNQIFKAIKQKKRKAYITKRWRLIAYFLKIVPTKLLAKHF